MAETSTTATPEVPKQQWGPGKKSPQIICAIIASIGGLLVGNVLAWTSPSLKHLGNYSSRARVHTRSSTEISLLSAWTPIGAIFGAFPAGFFADFFGRRTTLMMITVPWIIAWIILCCSPIPLLLHFARFITGFISGVVNGVVPMYLVEIAETSVRGRIGIFYNISATGGILTMYTLGTFDSYPLLGLTPAGISFLYFILLFYIPESPIILASKNRNEEARRNLRILRGSNYDVESEFQIIKRELRHRLEEESPTSLQTVHVFSKPNMKALMIDFTLMVAQQFAGINMVIFFSETLLKNTSASSASRDVVLIAIFSFFANILTSILVDKLGRRILLIFSLLGTATCWTILSYYMLIKARRKWPPVITLCMLVIVYGLGVGPISWLATAEVLTPEIKKIGTGIAVATSWGLAGLMAFLYYPLTQAIGEWRLFAFFSFSSFFFAAFFFFLLPETKGKSMREIRIALGDHHLLDDSDKRTN